MPDNRLELDIVATDNTGEATSKSRANIRSVEQEAARAAQSMSKGFDAQAVEMGRSIDKAAASAMRSLDALERRAALAGKSGVEKLVAQRSQMISSLGSDEAAIQRTMTAYDKLISARQRYEEQMAKMDTGGHGGNQALRRGILGVKDFLEGSTRGAIIEGTDILVGTSGGGGIIQKAIPQIAELTGLSNGAVIAVGGLTAAFLGLGVAGIESMKSLAATGEEIHNFSIRTGIAPTRAQAFQFAATATGQDPSIFERMTRGLAQASEDDSGSGSKARKELDQLGVSLYDRFGDLKPTEQIILDLADGLNKLPPGLERSASSMEIFKRIGVEAIPVLEGLRKNLATSDEIGGTFSEHDLQMMERWNDSLKRMGEEWKRFKLSVEVPLGIIGEVTIKGIKFLGVSGAGGIGIGGAFGTQLGQSLNSMLFQQGEITPPGADPDALRKIAEKDLADNERAKFLSLQRQDPAFRLNEARKKLTDYQAVAQHGSVDDVQRAEEQFRLVQQLEQKNKGALEGVVAARKERLQLESQYAEIQQSSQQKIASASINSSRELSSPADVAQQLRLAGERVNAEQQKILNDRRYQVDEKTGTIRDLSGTADYRQFQSAESANLPLRLRNEYAKVLGELEAQDARYFRARTDADAKGWEEAWQRRRNGELQLQQEEINTRQQIQSRQFDIDGQSIDRQREMALQGLDAVNAQTLQQKIALEDRKFAIEAAYAERSLGLQVSKIQNEQSLAIAEIQKKAAADGVDLNGDSVQGDIAATRDKYQQQIDAARASTSDKEIIDAQKTQAAKERLQIESSKRVYDSLKQDASGLFDQLVSHTKSWGDFAKDLFKSAILTPIKDIFSSQVAALFTKGLTGQDVSFGEVGNGQGTFGKLGSIFGRAGLGQPKFGSNQPITKLDQPGHLGDLSLVSGAVPVVLMNAGGSVPARASSGSGLSFGSLATGLGLGGIFAGGAAAAPSATTEAVTSTISYAGGGSETFGGLANLVGGPGGTSGFAGPVAGYGGNSGGGGILGSLLGGGGGSSSGGGGGILGSILGGGKSGGGGILGGLKGLLGQNVSGVDLGNGVGIANTGLTGHLAAFGQSGLAGMLGLGVAMDGIRRGGVLGTLEAAGGGAMVGFKYGGPIGAVIGAAVGGGIAAGKSIFGTTDRQHAKDLVKQVYGMDINNATADQIVQIAKQSYGNQIDMAVRSPQVRDLLKLYAQTLGNKKAEDMFVQDKAHSASFVENGGKLQQQAIYDNGNAYSYSSPLSVYGGVQTSPLSTYAPNQGVFSGNLSISLNGQSASDALAGQVVRVATPAFVQGQSLSASSSSIGRTSQQNMTLSPSALTR